MLITDDKLQALEQYLKEEIGRHEYIKKHHSGYQREMHGGVVTGLEKAKIKVEELFRSEDDK